jgi:hypothetical protein
MITFTTIIYAFLFLLISYGIAYIFRARKTKQLQDKVDRYRELLQAARKIRSKHIEAVQVSSMVATKESALSRELIFQKKKIIDIRSKLRKILNEIKQLSNYSTRRTGHIDGKVTAHKRIVFGQTWKFYNSQKASYSATKWDYDKVKEELQAAIEKENRTEEKWNIGKETVMRLYNILKEEWSTFEPPNFSGVEIVDAYKQSTSKGGCSSK